MNYLATGRIHPERADINFGPMLWQIPDQGKVIASCESSQVTIWIDLATIDGYVSAYLVAEQFSHIVVGALGFSLGNGYSVELIQITEEDGTPHVFGVRPTGTTPNATLGSVPHEEVFGHAFDLANRDLYFRLALRDYLRAGTYCYRAIEALKSSFSVRGGGNAWAVMHTALGTDRSSIESKIKAFADPVRHGNWVSAKPSTSLDRWNMLSLTRDVLYKYLEHERQASNPSRQPGGGAGGRPARIGRNSR
ncbi:MAG: hypothetical protein IPK78_07105 [Rhodospirillales bacterium]|nr:hypothetical protein [Rhodospirillales bacterium]